MRLEDGVRGGGRGGAASDFLRVFVAEVATSLVCVSVDLRNDELLCESCRFLVLQSADSLVQSVVGI